MKSLQQQLNEHFENTPKEELEKEYQEIHSLYGYGPTVEEYIQVVETYYCPYTSETLILNLDSNNLSDDFSCEESTDLNLAA